MAARTHGRGQDTSGTYIIWKLMRRRCQKASCIDYKNYGGRGIKVCKRWDDFIAFAKDMGERPAGMTLERIDNHGPYSKKNCKWLPKSEQRINTRETHLIEHDRRKQPLSFWAKELGISSEALKYRIGKYGVHKGITMPVNLKKVKAGKASVRAQGRHALIKRARIRWKEKPRVSLKSLTEQYAEHKEQRAVWEKTRYL